MTIFEILRVTNRDVPYDSTAKTELIQEYRFDVMRIITREFDNRKCVQFIQSLKQINIVLKPHRVLLGHVIHLNEVISLYENHRNLNHLISIIQEYYPVKDFTLEDDFIESILFKDPSTLLTFREEISYFLSRYLEILDSKQVDIWKINKALSNIEDHEKPKYMSRKNFAANLGCSYDTLNRFIKEEGIREEIPKGKLSPETQQLLIDKFKIWRMKK